MTVRLIYDDQYFRTIPAAIKEARASIPAVRNKSGVATKIYTDSQVALVGPNTIPYKIETFSGNIAGIATLQVNPAAKTVGLQQFVLRPAFIQFSDEITQFINIFITNNLWQADFLF